MHTKNDIVYSILGLAKNYLITELDKLSAEPYKIGIDIFGSVRFLNILNIQKNITLFLHDMRFNRSNPKPEVYE